MQRYGQLAFAITLFLLVGATLPSSNDKELIIRLQGEILVLQRQMRDLQESFDKWQMKSENSLDKLNSASDVSSKSLLSIDDKLQRNQGAQSNTLAGVNNHLAKISEQISINNQQVSQLNQQVGSLKQSLQEFQRKTQERDGLELRSAAHDPDLALALAYLKYKQGEYGTAINLFREYLKSSGQNERSDDAVFWIAESLASQGKLAEALNEYDNILARYPKGDRAASAQLKKGLVLLRQEKRQDGVEALKNVLSLYPNSQEAEMARSELTRLGEIENTAPQSAPSSTPRQRPLR
ncbi:MAG: tetratricopeptide repeat protein [Gammaproteobacteria bacterium]|nr:tetratricopeptide repeat protein [Gammaproteobacteria bacterium]